MIVFKDDDALTKFVLDTFVTAAKTVAERATERARISAEELAAAKRYAHEHKQSMTGDYWQQAHRDEQARIAAHRIVRGFTGEN